MNASDAKSDGTIVIYNPELRLRQLNCAAGERPDQYTSAILDTHTARPYSYGTCDGAAWSWLRVRGRHGCSGGRTF